MKEITKYFETETEAETRQKLGDELDNWSWASREQKDLMLKTARTLKTDTKYGPVYQISFMDITR